MAECDREIEEQLTTFDARTDRRRRESRPMARMLLHIDGSKHHWFGDHQRAHYAQLVEEESTRTLMAAAARRDREGWR